MNRIKSFYDFRQCAFRRAVEANAQKRVNINDGRRQLSGPGAYFEAQIFAESARKLCIILRHATGDYADFISGKARQCRQPVAVAAIIARPRQHYHAFGKIHFA